MITQTKRLQCQGRLSRFLKNCLMRRNGEQQEAGWDGGISASACFGTFHRDDEFKWADFLFR